MPRDDRALLLDWGNTLMTDIPGLTGPMAGWPHVEVVPGVPEALGRLQPEWRLCLATNAADSEESDIWAALRRGYLADLIDAVYCFRRLGCRKPSAAFFAAVLADLDLPPERVIMVGDSREDDVEGALRAGLRAVWFHPYGPGAFDDPRVRTLRNFQDLPSLIREFAPDLCASRFPAI